MYKSQRRFGLHPALLLLLILSLSCGTSGSDNETSLNLAPFIRMARNADCNNIRNNLYVIDSSLVLWDRAGDCPDNSYAQTLYSQNIEQVRCSHFDSIAGPMTIYHDLRYKELFDAAIANLDRRDLGLGSGHSIMPVSTVGTACADSIGCLPAEYCAKATGDCTGQGVCTIRPEVCPLAPVAIGDLVCGCDGQTYGSSIGACDAAMQGVNLAHSGACQ